jgi:NAD+ kinase
MANRFKHAALVGKYSSTSNAANAASTRGVLDEIARFLIAQGLEVSLERETALNTGITDHGALTPSEIGQRCDIAVVVGGDGTMLGIARQLARFGTPLVGINQGRLGFITDVAMDQYAQALKPMLAGEYVEERRTMLEGGVWRKNEDTDEVIFEGYALNDVVVSRGVSASMVELEVRLGAESVTHMRADGLIVASPTGSTAYALSAGGPILHPSISGWVLAPIAPHDLSNRPIVLPDAGEISIHIVNGRDASVNFDMQSLASLMQGDRITVRRSVHQVHFLHPHGWSYYATLRGKLHWNRGAA